MNQQPLHIASLVEAHQLKDQGFTGILSIESPVWIHGFPLTVPPDGPEHLILRFDDLDEEASSGFEMPRLEDTERILAFGRRHAHGCCLIHCFLGVSRSTAAALLILADRLGPGREEEAIREMVSLRPQAVPNLALICQGDVALKRGGALAATVQAWERSHPANALYRIQNRIAVLRRDPAPVLNIGQALLNPASRVIRSPLAG